jgi:hypothetical protein
MRDHARAVNASISSASAMQGNGMIGDAGYRYFEGFLDADDASLLCLPTAKSTTIKLNAYRPARAGQRVYVDHY